jgi:hypothetical protein
MATPSSSAAAREGPPEPPQAAAWPPVPAPSGPGCAVLGDRRVPDWSCIGRQCRLSRLVLHRSPVASNGPHPRPRLPAQPAGPAGRDTPPANSGDHLLDPAGPAARGERDNRCQPVPTRSAAARMPAPFDGVEAASGADAPCRRMAAVITPTWWSGRRTARHVPSGRYRRWSVPSGRGVVPGHRRRQPAPTRLATSST